MSPTTKKPHHIILYCEPRARARSTSCLWLRPAPPPPPPPPPPPVPPPLPAPPLLPPPPAAARRPSTRPTSAAPFYYLYFYLFIFMWDDAAARRPSTWPTSAAPFLRNKWGGAWKVRGLRRVAPNKQTSKQQKKDEHRGWPPAGRTGRRSAQARRRRWPGAAPKTAAARPRPQSAACRIQDLFFSWQNSFFRDQLPCERGRSRGKIQGSY